MKRILTIFCIAIISLMLTGCAGGNKPIKQKIKPVQKPVVKKEVPKSILWYAKNKEVYEVSAKTIKEIVNSKNIKKKTQENNILILLDELGIKESLNLKDLNRKYENIKQTENDFVITGAVGSEYSIYFGYVIFFDKNTLNITKMYCLKKVKVFDISNDMKTILTMSTKKFYPKEGGLIFRNTIRTYNIDTQTFSDVTTKYMDVEKVEFSPLGNYIILYGDRSRNKNYSSYFYIIDIKSKKEVFSEMELNQKHSLYFEYSFSPNEKYFYIKIENRNQDLKNILNVYKTNSFKKIFSFSSKSITGSIVKGISNKYLFSSFNNSSKKYDLEKNKLTNSRYIPYISYSFTDKKDGSLLYMIGTDFIYIDYIKDNMIFLIKTISKKDGYTKKSFISDNKLFIFPKFENNSFEIIDIGTIDLENYNFKLAKELKVAKEFYDAGFKQKALNIYKNLSTEKEFFAYIKGQSFNTQLDNYIKLLEYQQTKNIEPLSKYILNALQYGYIDEAKKALDELKKSNEKELYSVLDAVYLAQIGKEDIAYNTLVDKIPFSEKTKSLIASYKNSSLKIFKDKAKASLIFRIDQSVISYNELKKKYDFISFEGNIIDVDSKSTSNDTIELLD